MFILEGFIIGFFGGFHCIGMCGPIVLVIPLKGKSLGSKVFGSLLYNLGRAITYAMLGLLFGLIGLGMKMTGIQQWVSIACGAVMILSVLISKSFNVSSLLSKINPVKWLGIQDKMAKLLKAPKQSTLFIIGIVNGFLPCGLVYIALAGAIVGASVVQSSMFMFAFGLGTLPYLFVVLLFGNTLTQRYAKMVNKILPILIVFLGLLFILRGANLGIKYVSPKFGHDVEQTHSCH